MYLAFFTLHQLKNSTTIQDKEVKYVYRVFAQTLE